MEGAYKFLSEEPHARDFERVEQVTFGDDLVYGFKDLRLIRQKTAPQSPSWRKFYDDAS